MLVVPCTSGDMSHSQSEEICRMAGCLGLEMKFLRERAGGRERDNLQDNLVEEGYLGALQY